MPASIEIYEDMAAFASLREPAWHGLGTVFDEPVSTDEMLRLAHLAGWNVRLEEIPAYIADVNFDAFVPYLTVRDNPFIEGQIDALGVVGERYNVFQNEQLFDFGDSISDRARWETAGSIRNGRVVFGSLALDADTVTLDPNGRADIVKTYLLVTTSHDGSTAITAAITPTRVVCQNTLTVALRDSKRTYKFRHTQTANGRVADARESLGLTVAYMDEFSKAANEMIEREINAVEFYKIVNAAYPAPTNEDKKSETRYMNKIDQIVDLYNGETNANIVGTAWGAYNALTERLDWGRTVRGGNAEGRFIAAAGMDPVSNSEKSRLFRAVRDVVFA